MKKIDENQLISLSVNGDRKALEQLLAGVQDLVFNLSLRMLGTIIEAQDASQDIMVKIITNLSSFKQNSLFSTWVYRLSVNSLLNHRKTILSKQHLSFDTFSSDISQLHDESPLDTFAQLEEEELAYELKLSCSNVMLQCLDPISRCVFILGTMFQVDSKTAGEIMNISPEAYRKRLSRSRQKMSDFMSIYCGLANGKCSCEERIGMAIKKHRLNPENLEYTTLSLLPKKSLNNSIDAMNNIDIASTVYSRMKKYASPKQVNDFLLDLLNSNSIQIIKKLN